MKSLNLLMCLFLVSLVYGQSKVVVTVSPSSGDLYYSGHLFPAGKKMKLKNLNNNIVAVEDGYATAGYTYEDLSKLGQDVVIIELSKIEKLTSDYNSREIVINKITDITGLVERGSIILNDPLYKSRMNDAMVDFGYNLHTNNDEFGDFGEQEKSKTDIAINCTIVSFTKGTRGLYFQPCMIFEWKVYDYAKKKVVLKMRTAGRSDQGGAFRNEIRHTFADGITGLINSAEFKRIASK